MSVLKRNAVVGAVVVLAGVLSACSGGESAGSSPGGQETQVPSSGQAGSQINNPKDAAKPELCSLLPADAATSLRLAPQGEVSENTIDADAPPSCGWQGDGGSSSLDLTVFDGRSIQTYYDLSDTYTEFQKLTIAGHPAVKANKKNSMEYGTCAMYMATKEDQVVFSYSSLSPGETGKVDPCIMATQALEKSVPTWPSAK